MKSISHYSSNPHAYVIEINSDDTNTPFTRLTLSVELSDRMLSMFSVACIAGEANTCLY